MASQVTGDVTCTPVPCDPTTIGRRQPELGDDYDLLEGFDLTIFEEVPNRSNWGYLENVGVCQVRSRSRPCGNVPILVLRVLV